MMRFPTAAINNLIERITVIKMIEIFGLSELWRVPM
jgi:hypothetical protein